MAELRARYDDGRLIRIEPCINHEVAVTIGYQSPVFMDGLDLLRAVSSVVLDELYGPSPTDTDEKG